MAKLFIPRTISKNICRFLRKADDIQMKTIVISDTISHGVPALEVIQIEAAVTNPPTSDGLWNELEEAGEDIRSRYDVPMVNKREPIAATRQAYKTFGKDPNRYRPSAEALCRRMANGKGLYRTSTLIDLINLLSMKTGCSIGGFDADKIEGDELTLGVGENGEDFDAIGRGPLNIEGLPVYRDSIGGIGTPTSDCERTKLTDSTSRLLMLINVYGRDMELSENEDMARRLLADHAGASEIECRVVRATK